MKRNPPLTVGDTFVIRTGPRKMYYVRFLAFFQKDNRRYHCRVAVVTHERYRFRGDLRLRCVCEVKVVEV